MISFLTRYRYHITITSGIPFSVTSPIWEPVITSNVKSDKTLVVVKDNRDSGEKIETGLKKFGAMLGDHVEVGCNSVLNPGTVICPNCNVYPLSSVRGVIPANHIYKDADHIVAKKEK